MPSLTDIPSTFFRTTNPRAIINWLAPMKLPLHVKRTLFRKWATATKHDSTAADYQLIKSGNTDNR